MVITVIATLLLLVPQALFVRNTNAKYTENMLSYEKSHFLGVTAMAKQHILDFMENKTESVYNAGLTLSLIGSSEELEDSYFPALYDRSQADEILIYASDGSLTYGKAEYGSLFLKTAQDAFSSGETAVSQLKKCDDGLNRMAIASRFSVPDGKKAAIMLLFSQVSFENMLDNLSLKDEGGLGIINENGVMVLCRSSDETWFRNGQYAFGESGGLKEQLLSATRTTDDKKLTAYIRELGFNNWLVIYMLPSEKINLSMDSALEDVNLFSMVAVLLVLGLIAFSLFNANRVSKHMALFNMKFRIATKQSARAAYEYDRRTDKLKFISESEYVKLPKPYVSLMELGTYVHPADRPTYYQSVSDLRSKGETSVIVRLISFCGRDVYRWYHVTGTRLTDKGEGEALTIGTVEDIDEQENERLILHEQATTDSLTGLRNRAETEKAINEYLMRLEETEHSVFALLDLDNFKEINDNYGHDCGDRALVFFADKLRTTFRFGDILGRLGGDEFVVYMTLTADRKIVERRLFELMDSLTKDDLSSKLDIPSLTCSIGCCIASRGDTFDAVYKRADNAMYKSKNNGKGQFTLDD
ncbi:MAG: GGDEF domain-containing protein [Oscillospiraceae bacterium]